SFEPQPACRRSARCHGSPAHRPYRADGVRPRRRADRRGRGRGRALAAVPDRGPGGAGVIAVEDLWKSFRSVQAVRGGRFLARDGAITGLIGPNGAGKTTTLRVLYTVLKPDRGRALVDGHDSVTERRAVQSRIGVLPDSRGLYPRLTAREHIRY